MEVRLEQTEGLGRLAQVWVDGQLLTVCDNISTREKRCPPGLLENVAFDYTSQHTVWRQAIHENSSHKKLLEPVRGWSYVGYGQVLSIMPVVIDFGLLQMRDPDWSDDNRLIGRFVQIHIDRLELRRANQPDWPEGMK